MREKIQQQSEDERIKICARANTRGGLNGALYFKRGILFEAIFWSLM